MEVYNRRGIPKHIKLAIQQMFECDGFKEEFEYFITHLNELKNCSFIIYSDENGQEFPAVLKEDLNSDFEVIEAGCSSKFYVLDSAVCEDMINKGVAEYNLDICIELDTQVVSYLKNIFRGLSEINIPTDKMKLFSYLGRKDVNYSSLPYLFENAQKIDLSNFQECYLTLKSYEMFKDFDFKRYIDKNEIHFATDESNMLINVDNTFNMLKSRTYFENMIDLYDMQKNIYCLLMKAIGIEILNSKKSATNKMKMLIEFVNSELGIFCEREMAICYYYFNHDERTKKFFRKTNVNSKNVVKTIKGMAWDLTHVRLIERLFDFKVTDTIKFGIHPMLTYDNGLKEVLKLYPIKKIAIYDGYTIPSFKQKFYELYPNAIELLFEEQIAAMRKYVFENRNLQELIKGLEREIELLTGESA